MLGLIRARFLLPISDALGRGRRIEDGYALWRDDALLEVGPWDPATGARLLSEHGAALSVIGLDPEPKPARRVEDVVRHEGVLLPGFIKAHGHDLETPIIGLVKDVPLTAWLDGVVNVFNKFLSEESPRLADELSQDPHEIAYLKARLDDLYYGITSSMVHHCNYAKYHADALVAANRIAGTRIIVAIGSQDRHYYEKVLDTPEQAIERLDRYHEKHRHEPRATIIPGPDQLFSNGPVMLTKAKAWARDHGTLLHCHSSEEKRTTAWFKETYGESPVEYATRLGILDEGTVLAHQCQTTPRDIELIAKAKAKVVHNPLANTILGSGMPPLIEMMEAGIPVAIATDGSGSADNQNILAAARLASQYQKAFHKDAALLPAQRVLEMITAEAADILRLNAGRLEPGRAADIVLVTTERPNMTPTRRANVVENLIWTSDGSEVEVVIAGGRLLRHGKRYLSLDAPRVLSQITALAERFDAYRELHKPQIKGTGAHR